jgi:hypothetical protein
MVAAALDRGHRAAEACASREVVGANRGENRPTQTSAVWRNNLEITSPEEAAYMQTCGAVRLILPELGATRSDLTAVCRALRYKCQRA